MEFNPRIRKIASYPATELAIRKRKLKEQGVKVYDFGTGDPVEPTAAFIREAVGAGVPEISQYPTVRGVPALRSTIRGYVKRRFNVELDENREIIPCGGAKESIYSLTFLFISPESKKDVLIAPVPGYFVPERSSIVAGAHFYPFYLNSDNDFIQDLAVLPEEVLERTAIAWVNYPHNPTGKCVDLEYFKKQVEIAKKYDILLCSDECYTDLYFGDKAPPSVLQITKEGVLAFHSCSKRSGMTAYRTGFIAGDSKVLDLFASFRDTLGVASPEYTQAAAIKAWGDDAHVAERRAIFKAKQVVMRDFFKKHGFQFTESDAGLYYWVKAPAGFNGDTYANKLLEKGIIVNPGSFFGANSVDYFRIAFVPSVEECKAAVKIWEGV